MFKFIRFWFKSWFLSDNLKADAVSKVSFRVMPWDCDPNMHMTNSRYFYYMDYARFWRLVHMGVFREIMLKQRCLPMAVSQEITYIRDIAPLEKFEIQTELAGWDEKYFYITQDFYSKKGLCAKAMVRGLFLQNRAPVAVSKVLGIYGNPHKPVKFESRINTWKKLLELKKSESLT